MNKYKAIIFDYDGTLVDTEEICFKLYPVVFNDFNLVIDTKQILQLRSASLKLKVELFKKWFNMVDPLDLIKKIDDKLVEMFLNYINLYPIQKQPGCVEILEYLKNKNITTVIATSCDKETVLKQLKDVGILEYFKEVFSDTNLENGKPDPDIYLHTCLKLNLKPEECLVIEDSPNGVKAACEAGCNVVMIPDLSEPDEDLMKNHNFKVVKNLVDLKELL